MISIIIIGKKFGRLELEIRVEFTLPAITLTNKMDT